MRTLAIATLLCAAPLWAAPPGDAPPPAAPPVPELPADIPDACAPNAKLAASPVPSIGLAAKIALASCLADVNLKQLSLVDSELSVRQLDTATKPSVDLYDQVAAAGEPTWQIVALHAEAELLSSLVTRMQATVPVAGTTDEAIALHDMRVSMLDPLLQPWRERAHQAFGDIARVSKAHPELAKNPVVQSALRESEQRTIATRATGAAGG